MMVRPWRVFNLGGLTSRRPFTLLGILLAILVIAAFVLVAINASTGQSTAQQSVVVATRDLQPRIPIDASALEMRSIPVAGYPASLFFHNTADVKGMVPLVTIVSGQPITSNVIAKPGASLGAQSEYLPIPSGYVALQLPTSDLQGVGGNIQPDDYISIIATVDANGKIATKTIFHDIHVIRVGSAGTTGADIGRDGFEPHGRGDVLPVRVHHLVPDVRIAQVRARVVPRLPAVGLRRPRIRAARA